MVEYLSRVMTGLDVCFIESSLETEWRLDSKEDVRGERIN